MADGTVTVPVSMEVEKETFDTPSTIDKIKQLTDGIFRKLMAIVVLYFVLNFLFKIGIKSFDKDKWDILLMILTALINMSGILLGFYYASSQSSQDKDKRLDNLNEEPE